MVRMTYIRVPVWLEGRTQVELRDAEEAARDHIINELDETQTYFLLEEEWQGSYRFGRALMQHQR